VIHRPHIDRLSQMIELAENARRRESRADANVQFYGWAFRNRAALLPTREQVDRARKVATAAKTRLAGKIDIFYVLPDYYETRPKPCLNAGASVISQLIQLVTCSPARQLHQRFRILICENVRGA